LFTDFCDKINSSVVPGPTRPRKKGLVSTVCMCSIYAIMMSNLDTVNQSTQLSWIKQWSSTSIVHCSSPSRGLVALACVSSPRRYPPFQPFTKAKTSLYGYQPDLVSQCVTKRYCSS